MRVAIVDGVDTDRQIILINLKYFFSNFCLNLPLWIDEYESGNRLLQKFSVHLYDIIFMEYHLKGLSGIETAREIRKTDRTVALVFVTDSPDYAIECYKVRTFDYLLKPVSYESISDTLFLLDLKQIKASQFIEIGNQNKGEKLILSDIIYCDMSGHYAQFHTNTFGIKRARISFTEAAEKLASYPEFLLCYRGCIINMDWVINVDNLTFIMENGERVPFRKKEQTHIQKTYFEFLFEKARNNIVKLQQNTGVIIS